VACQLEIISKSFENILGIISENDVSIPFLAPFVKHSVGIITKKRTLANEFELHFVGF
jgi:hypothetical protein